MLRSRPLLVGALAATFLLAACGSSGSSGTSGTTAGGYGYGAVSSAPSTTTATSAPAASAPVVSSASTSLGTVLVDADGRTLYEYQPDPSGRSTCTGACASAWPPLTASGTVAVGSGLTASSFTTVNDGVVAVDGHALYRYGGDSQAGDTNGQGIGGIWHAAGADGSPIMS